MCGQVYKDKAKKVLSDFQELLKDLELRERKDKTTAAAKAAGKEVTSIFKDADTTAATAVTQLAERVPHLIRAVAAAALDGQGSAQAALLGRWKTEVKELQGPDILKQALSTVNTLLLKFADALATDLKAHHLDSSQARLILAISQQHNSNAGFNPQRQHQQSGRYQSQPYQQGPRHSSRDSSRDSSRNSSRDNYRNSSERRDRRSERTEYADDGLCHVWDGRVCARERKGMICGYGTEGHPRGQRHPLCR